MQSDRPLLTIAIPTYNRARFLGELLANLKPQLVGHGNVELLLSDNASPDDTAQVVEGFLKQGMKLRYVRNPTNIGPDRNFIQAFELASGKYFLLFGDDDLFVPGALTKIVRLLEDSEADVVYLSSYAFTSDFERERQGDPLRRTFRMLRDPLQFARIVNVMTTFISGIIVNRDRLAEIPHEPIAAFDGTFLVQLSWVLPLLTRHRQSICVWDRLVAGRSNNSGGYNIARVFGVNFKHMAHRLLPGLPRIAQALSNAALRRWFPGSILELRQRHASSTELNEIEAMLRAEHGRNPRFWMFVYPTLHAPLALAAAWVGFTRAVNKAIYMVHLPSFRRSDGEWRDGGLR